MAKDTQREDLSLPWGRDPLKGLVEVGPRYAPRGFDPRKVKDRARRRAKHKKGPKRYRFALKDQPWCTGCGRQNWGVVINDERYRDPYLSCGSCEETYRLDLTVLDLRYAWRDGIKMPHEVQHKHTKHGFEEYHNEV